MTKKFQITSEYKRQRKNYLAKVNRYKKLGYDISDNLKPKIPKRITEASIRNIQSLENKLKAKIHEQKVETGYYTRQRHQREAKAAIKKAAQKQPKSTQKKTYKKSPIQTPSQIPKTKGSQPKPPNLSDAVLRSFESEMTIANTFIAKSKPFQDAVNNSADELQNKFNEAINDVLSYYMPDLTNHDVRVEIANKLAENFENYMSEMETFLYEFISDGQGHLNHTEAGIQAKISLLQAITDTKISIEHKMKLSQIANEYEDGEVVKKGDSNYDY